MSKEKTTRLHPCITNTLPVVYPLMLEKLPISEMKDWVGERFDFDLTSVRPVTCFAKKTLFYFSEKCMPINNRGKAKYYKKLGRNFMGQYVLLPLISITSNKKWYNETTVIKLFAWDKPIFDAPHQLWKTRNASPPAISEMKISNLSQNSNYWSCLIFFTPVTRNVSLNLARVN